MAEPANVSGGGDRPALLVLHVGPGDSIGSAITAEAVYRTVQPCRALGELPDVAVISGSILSPELYQPLAGAPGGADLLSSADVLVIRDVADADLLSVVGARRREGRITVFEPGARLFAPAGAAALPDLASRSLAPQLARLADGVQVAGFGLEAQLESLNPRRARFPSQLWEAPAPGLPPGRQDADGTIVLGWMGGAAEREDLATAIPALARLLDRHPQLRIAILADGDLAPALAGLPAERVKVTAGGSLAVAERFRSGLDIGLLPLAAGAQDRFVSDLPALAYAAQGVLVVCADAEPFRELVQPGQTALVYRDAAELESAIDRALAEPDLRATVIARAAQAAAERVERPQAASRLAFYLSLAAQRGIRWPPREGPTAATWLAAADAGQRFPGSQYAALGTGEVERLLVEGTQRRAADDPSGAARAFAEAEHMAPGSHLPPLLLASVLLDPARAIDALARAEARRPTSCRAAYERGLRELARGGESAAAAAFERACAAAPAFGAPQERLGQLAEAAGRSAEALRLYEEAALQNPSFALPVARLAVQAQRRGEIFRAVALLERALAADPDLPLTHFLLARAYLDLGRLHQARAHLDRAGADGGEGWSAHLPPGLEEAVDRAATLEALARAENRG